MFHSACCNGGSNIAGRTLAIATASGALLCGVLLSGCRGDGASSNGAAAPAADTATDDSSRDGTTSPEEGPQWKTGRSFTVYYESSPAQGRPPDGEIPPGTIVKLIEEAGSYSWVEWDGKSVWVAADALQQVNE